MPPSITRIGRIEMGPDFRLDAQEAGHAVRFTGWEFDGERPERLDQDQTLAVIDWLEGQVRGWREIVRRNGLSVIR